MLGGSHQAKSQVWDQGIAQQVLSMGLCSCTQRCQDEDLGGLSSPSGGLLCVQTIPTVTPGLWRLRPRLSGQPHQTPRW